MNSDVNGINADLVNSGEDRILRVTGSVRTPLLFSMEDLRALEVNETVDISIQSGIGDPRAHIRISRGVFLEKVIRMAEPRMAEADDLNNMIVVASADDGHKVIFSWKEICNTSVGNGVMILLEKDGQTLDKAQGLCHLMSTQDYFTDSRYVQGLRNIEVVLAH